MKQFLQRGGILIDENGPRHSGDRFLLIRAISAEMALCV